MFTTVLNPSINSYVDVVTPLQNDGEIIRTDIQEELADIYQNVAEGLVLYKTGYESDGLWHWRLTFEFHWGRRLLSIIDTLTTSKIKLTGKFSLKIHQKAML